MSQLPPSPASHILLDRDRRLSVCSTSFLISRLSRLIQVVKIITDRCLCRTLRHLEAAILLEHCKHALKRVKIAQFACYMLLNEENGANCGIRLSRFNERTSLINILCNSWVIFNRVRFICQKKTTIGGLIMQTRSYHSC